MGTLKGRLARSWRWGTTFAVVLGMLMWGLFSPAQAEPSTIGQWTAPFDLPVVGIHSHVLPSGKVLLFAQPAADQAGTPARLWDPATGAITNVSQRDGRDAFCSGHSALPDGRIYVTGGHVLQSVREDGLGVKDTDLFDPTTETWASGPYMSEARWYPTNIQLADGTTLVFGGQAAAGTPSTTVESYDPASNTLTTLPSTASKHTGSYPRMHLMPSGKVFWSGPWRGTQYFNPATNTWSWVGNRVFAARNNGNSVLLPGLQKVLAVGGKNSTDGVTATAEIADLSVPKPTWRYTASMNVARHHANAVLLPDGKVLVVGGGQGGSYNLPVTQAELFDPATETWTTMASQTAPRIYHSTAVLLPDGRVLSAGTDKGTFQRTGEIFSPPYLFKGPRPVIGTAPGSLGYGQQFAIDTNDASNIARVALIKPGSVTHSVDFDQRYVDLPFTRGENTLMATSPPNGNHAPAGWYMLFIVTSAGIPSVASWVHVG